MKPLDFSLMAVYEKLHSEDGQDRIVFEKLSFLMECYIYWTGVFVHCQSVVSCVDNAGKLYFVFATDVGILCNCVKRYNALY